MTRIPVLAAVVLWAVSPTAAQTHTQSHPQGSTHDASGHQRVDPALHALLHGGWTGTLAATGGSAQPLDLSVDSTKGGDLGLRLKSQASSLAFGDATGVMLDGSTLRWSQVVAGATCRASVTVTPATAKEPDRMNGTLSCADGQRVLALHKTSK